MSTLAFPKPRTARVALNGRTRRILELGGIVAGVILIAFGAASLVLGANGRSTVHHSLALEQIVGSPDMTPAAIKAEAAPLGLKNVDWPTVAVAGKKIDTGAEARAFASYMRIHTLEATGGYTYAQMGRYQALPSAPKSELAVGGGTDNAKFAATDPKTQRPLANKARDIWVTETALTTALNTSYMAEQLSLFSVVVGVALLLSGIGFVILAVGGALRGRQADELAAK